MSTSLKEKPSLLFVCLGNICRSPAAENICRAQLKSANLDHLILLDSAGTINFHQGKKPDSRMTTTLAKRGIPNPGSARQIKSNDLENFDLILVADPSNLADVQKLTDEPALGQKIMLLSDFCTEFDADHIPDPYYGGPDGFEHVADLLDDACHNLIKHLHRKGLLPGLPVT